MGLVLSHRRWKEVEVAVTRRGAKERKEPETPTLEVLKSSMDNW